RPHTGGVLGTLAGRTRFCLSWSASDIKTAHRRRAGTLARRTRFCLSWSASDIKTARRRRAGILARRTRSLRTPGVHLTRRPHPDRGVEGIPRPPPGAHADGVLFPGLRKKTSG